jgi:hypothetical protein
MAVKKIKKKKPASKGSKSSKMITTYGYTWKKGKK